MEQTIELPAFRRSAELAPNSIDPETRSVEVIWSTGARVRRAALFGEPHDEELSMAPEHVRLERLNAGAPFLKVHEAHDLDAVIGSVVPGSARIENGQGIARIRLSERDAVGDIWPDLEAAQVATAAEPQRYAPDERAAADYDAWFGLYQRIRGIYGDYFEGRSALLERETA